jgi:ribulose-bisphosphate carboxylase large chain
MSSDANPTDFGEITARYLMVTADDPAAAAHAIAGEMSSGTFRPVPGETPELSARHRARVIDLSPAPDTEARRLCVSGTPWTMSITVPAVNVGASLSQVLATVAGNIFELAGPAALLLEGLDLPQAVTAPYLGPQFGIAGSRRVLQVTDRPMFGSIVKPSVGLSPDASSELARKLAVAGLDFLKDDELQANSPHSPFVDRHRQTTRALDEAAALTGRRMPYAFNITGDIEDMKWRLDLLGRDACDIAMVVVPAVGLPALSWLRRHSNVPIHAHRAGWAVHDRGARFGISFTVWQQLWRHCGADQVHIGGLRSKFYEDDSAVLRAFEAVSRPLNASEESRGLPVLSSAQTPEHVGLTLRATGGTDFLMLAGGGIMAHPDGPAEGVRAFHTAYADAEAERVL